MTKLEIEAIRKRVEKAKEYGEGVGGMVFEDIPALLAHIDEQAAEIERLRNAISWGVSCIECSNQLAEEWDIIDGSFICQECIDWEGISE